MFAFKPSMTLAPCSSYWALVTHAVSNVAVVLAKKEAPKKTLYLLVGGSMT